MILLFVSNFVYQAQGQPGSGFDHEYSIYLPNNKEYTSMKVYNIYLENENSEDPSYLPRNILDDIIIREVSTLWSFQNLEFAVDTIRLFSFFNYRADRLFYVKKGHKNYYFLVSQFLEENIILNNLPDKSGVYIIESIMDRGQIIWRNHRIAKTKDINQIKGILLSHQLQLGWENLVNYSALNAWDIYRDSPQFLSFIQKIDHRDQSYSFFYTYPYARAIVEIIKFDGSTFRIEDYIKKNANHMTCKVMMEYFDSRNIDFQSFNQQLKEYNAQIDSLKRIAPEITE